MNHDPIPFALPDITEAEIDEVVRYMGAKPVMVDVLPGDHNIDPVALEAAITENTKAIIPVHFGG